MFKPETARAKRAKLRFLLLNIQMCDVLRDSLNSKIWMQQPHIKLIVMTICFMGGVTFQFSGKFFSGKWVGTLSHEIVGVHNYIVSRDRFGIISINTELITL